LNDFSLSKRIKSKDINFIKEFTELFKMKRQPRLKNQSVDKLDTDQNRSDLIKNEFDIIIKRICYTLNLDMVMIYSDKKFLRFFCETVATSLNNHLKICYQDRNTIKDEDLIVNIYGYSKPDFRRENFQNLPIPILSKSGSLIF
jgi:hypothetical protein